MSKSQSDQGKVLLSYLESSRDLLARCFIHEHHAVIDPDLNYITVSSVFMIIFLKTGQACGFVEPGTLTALAGCDGIAKRMARACSDAGLISEMFFEKGPVGSRVIPGLPDEPLREIIHKADTPTFPVPISQLPLEELVITLEQFLGTKMQAAEGCHVNRVGKSAMLYTGVVDIPPQREVEYIVSEAIGGINGGIMTFSTRACCILDPACGTGLFLLAVYRYLVRSISKSVDRQDPVQNILKNIIRNSLFGTDIDPESVSAARTVLLFAFIEESMRSGTPVVSPGQIREVCWSLTNTIRCGNALIAPDYFLGKPVYPFNAEERHKVNPLDWKKAFPEIMDQGGFDAVICAPPPYRPFGIQPREEYFQTHYNSYAPSACLFGYFIERAFSLLKPGGIIAVLVPGTFLRSQNTRPLRRLLLSRQIITITNTCRSRPLPEGEVMMYVLVLQNQPPDRPFSVLLDWKSAGSRQGVFTGPNDFWLDQCLLHDGGWTLHDTRKTEILEKIQKTGTPLEQYVMGEIGTGMYSIKNNPRIVDRAMKNRLTKGASWCRHVFVPLLRPVDIRRYVPEIPDRFVLSIQDSQNLKKCRELVRLLETIKGEKGRDSGFDDNKEYHDSENDGPKIIFAPFQHRPTFCYDPKGSCATANTLLTIPRKDPFLAGILNSSLGRFVITHTCPLTNRGYHLSPKAIGRFPIYIIDFDNPDDKARHDRMVTLVTEMLDLHKHLGHAKTDREKRLIVQEIESTDRQIDSLVYGLYGLTADEIAVVEEAVSK